MLLTHALAEFYHCDDQIEDAAALIEIAKDAAQAVGATVVGEITIRYVPHGLTIGVFLAESHIVLTTWPEHRLLLVDILLCNAEMNYRVVIAEIERRLCSTGRTVVHEIPRHISDDPA